eukprot:TRINITY_DN12453_c0_g1_i3.p1 TRINITY_DN12453_c0_g1~~TRINITY_DN12453_c0_g1_i3.p1  ORF type:complete len:681 (+),score=150.26 TRINITY_DN12453_c0_g1_i3:3-2045(+)
MGKQLEEALAQQVSQEQKAQFEKTLGSVQQLREQREKHEQLLKQQQQPKPAKKVTKSEQREKHEQLLKQQQQPKPAKKVTKRPKQPSEPLQMKLRQRKGRNTAKVSWLKKMDDDIREVLEEEEPASMHGISQITCLAMRRAVRDLHGSTVSMPRNFFEAFDTAESEEWKTATKSELDKLMTAATVIEQSEVPEGEQVIPARVVFDIKNIDSVVAAKKHKVRITARGDLLHYDGDVFAQGYHGDSLRMFIALSTLSGLELHQGDVTGAYLSAKGEHVTYVRIPPGLEEFGFAPGSVWRFHNAIYGTQSAGRAWCKFNVEIMVKHLGFRQLESCPEIFIREQDGNTIIAHVATDDFLMATNSAQHILQFIRDYQHYAPLRYEGRASKYLGWNIVQSEDNLTTSIDQREYIEKLSKIYKVKPLSRGRVTPLKQGDQFMPCSTGPVDDGDACPVESKQVFELYGQLNWIVNGTRPDGREALSELGSFLQKPSRKLWEALLHLLSYLVTTVDEKLVYGGLGDSPHELVAFCDAGHNPRFTEGKSRMGYVVKINGGAVIWNSCLQSVIAQSTAEAEYIALAETCKQIIYARIFAEELNLEYQSAVSLFSDSQSALTIAKNGDTNRQTRHIALRFHLIRFCVKHGIVQPEFVRGADNPADQLTKRLNASKNTYCRNAMMRASMLGCE